MQMMRNDIMNSNSSVNGKWVLNAPYNMFAYHGKRQAEAKVPIGETQFPTYRRACVSQALWQMILVLLVSAKIFGGT
jgi:hypothetical protein